MTEFSFETYKDTLMGPDSYLLTMTLADCVPLKENARILDLASGKGLSSIALAHKYPKAQIFSVDPWISPRRNHARFRDHGLSNRIIPLWGTAEDLPFAYFYFDAIFCIDAFHIFGKKRNFLDDKIVHFLKKDGYLALMMPGFTEEFISLPEPLQPFPIQDLDFYAFQEWTQLFRESKFMTIHKSFTFNCHEQAWTHWLESGHPAAVKDRSLYEQGKKYINSLGFVLQKEVHQEFQILDGARK